MDSVPGSALLLLVVSFALSWQVLGCFRGPCRLTQHGRAVLVDGAHAVGAMPLSVPSLGAHFYCSNLHKWAATAKGCAFLWVAPSEQQHVLPPVTSHGYGLVRSLGPCSLQPLHLEHE